MRIPKISYVNGRYVPYTQASIGIEDRGNVFSDGAYEGIALINGKLLDLNEHFERLQYSLNILSIKSPMKFPVMKIIINELARRNKVTDGFVYLQISRGNAMRNHQFPNPAPNASLIITIHDPRKPSAKLLENGINVVTHPDLRMKRRDAKTISLLPNIQAKQYAIENEATESWLFEENGKITEGSASNAFIIDDIDTIITHPENQSILGGITRMKILQLARKNSINVREEAFSTEDIKSAKEAFASSTTMRIMPVTKIDGEPVNDGKVGKITKQLIALYDNYIREQT